MRIRQTYTKEFKIEAVRLLETSFLPPNSAHYYFVGRKPTK